MSAKNAMSLMAAMSGTVRKIRRWEKARIITAEQRDAILAYEKEYRGKRLARGLIGLALFAIGLGILSIVAANWMHIPGGVKIGAHSILNAAAATAMWKAAAKDNKWWREGASFIFFALNLTLIVLIGQVFQLSGNWACALSLWLAISSPALFIYGHTIMNAGPWMIALIATIFFVLTDIIDNVGELNSFLIGLAATLFIPLGFLAAGGSEKLAAVRPHWTAAAFRMGIILLIVMATGASFYWYADLSNELRDLLGGSGYVYMLLICAAAIGSVYGYDLLRRRKNGDGHDQTGVLFVIGSLASSIIPLVLMPDSISFMAAVHFIAYWVLVGYAGYRIGWDQLVSHAITLITLRIIAVYVELFGGLLLTGFGLIGGGVLLLVTVRAARWVQRSIKQVSYEGGEDAI